MNSKALESALGYFSIENNALVVGGKTLAEWAEEVSTPFYLYDMSVVERKIALFRESMPGDVLLYYAVKANPHPELLRRISSKVDGFDVASKGELEAVIQAGAKAEGIGFAGPGKTESELERAVDYDIGSLNIESERELESVARIAERTGSRPKVSVRINPDFELHGSGMKMGGGPKPFGIDSERVPAVLKRILELPVRFRGFHVYAGSQNLSAETVAECMEKTLGLIWRIVGEVCCDVELINLGGGFGIPYYENDRELEIGRIGVYLEVLLRKYRPRFPGAKFVVELGRFLTGECGIYATKVLYRKRSRGKTYLVTDGGMNHHLAASGNFGQVLKKNFPIVAAGKINGAPTEQVDVVGPLCTPLDRLAQNAMLPETREGDIIAVLNSGAYGYTASPILFLGRTKPAEIVA